MNREHRHGGDNRTAQGLILGADRGQDVGKHITESIEGCE